MIKTQGNLYYSQIKTHYISANKLKFQNKILFYLKDQRHLKICVWKNVQRQKHAYGMWSVIAGFCVEFDM